MKSVKILYNANKLDSPNSDYYTFRFAVEGSIFGSDVASLGAKGSNSLFFDNGSTNRFIIKGWIDQDTYEEEVKSNYEQIMKASGATDSINNLMSMTGLGSIVSKYQYRKVWQGCEPQVFSFNLFFQAEKDAFSEVVLPIRNLQALALPIDTVIDSKTGKREEKLFLIPPSTEYVTSTKISLFFQRLSQIVTGNKADNKNKLTEIRVGNFVGLRNVILESVKASWDIQNVDSNGYPLSAKVTVNVISIDIWTQQTIRNLIKYRFDDDEFKPIDIDKILGGFVDNFKSLFGG
jgi:hypothetical protein